jgi:hypothetical protein
MTSRDTYNASLKSAAATKTVSLTANEIARQTAVDAQTSVVGYRPGVSLGSSSNLEAAVKTANQAKWDADFAAEQVKQAAHAVARDTLRAAGDLAPL